MHTDDVRALFASEQPGKAEVLVRLKATLDEGKEVVRDSKDRLQGVVERTFMTVSIDSSKVAA